MRLILTFARMYPRQSVVMLGCLLLAAVAEGLGLSTLLPLLGLATTSHGGVEGTLTKGSSPLSHTIGNVLVGLGFELTIGTLCCLLSLAMFLKAGLMLLAQKQVGYTVAESRYRFAPRTPACGTWCTMGILHSPTCGWIRQCIRNRGKSGLKCLSSWCNHRRTCPGGAAVLEYCRNRVMASHTQCDGRGVIHRWQSWQLCAHDSPCRQTTDLASEGTLGSPYRCAVRRQTPESDGTRRIDQSLTGKRDPPTQPRSSA